MAEKKKPLEDEVTAVETVKMVRATPQFPGGPVEADVHPDEVTNYASGGWQLTEVPKAKQ